MSSSHPRPRRPFWQIREHLSPWAARGLGLIPIPVIWAVWWWVTRDRVPGMVESRIVTAAALPSPREMFDRNSLRILWFDKELSRSALVSLERVTAGFALALAVVLPLGLSMGSCTKVKAMFQPFMVAGGYTPVAALVPLTMVWFGVAERQKVGFLAIATFVYLLPMIVQAVDNVDHVLIQTAQTQGASRWQIVSRVLLPVALPDIYGAMRLGFGVAWSWIILAEVVAAENGLGFIINVAQGRSSHIEHVYLTLVVIVLIAFAIDRLWSLGYRACFPYRSALDG
ncbi:MAG: ABC transporter permease subunit [Armatimonadetes bacterium]|nr:ABC transporter permease subunit [Armatimonadota bacterium]